MPTGERADPYHVFNFRVEIDRVDVAGFSECSGLTFDVDPVEYREGTDQDLNVRKLIGLNKFANIVLKRGFTDNTDLWNWYKAVRDGLPDRERRRNGAIILQNEQHRPVSRWEFTNGWICKWEGPSFNATSNDVAIESIEICVERVDQV